MFHVGSLRFVDIVRGQKRAFYQLLSIALIWAAAICSWAQQADPASQAAIENEKRLKEESLRHERQLELKPKAPDIFLQQDDSVAPNTPLQNTTCFDIKEINVKLPEVLNKKNIDAITSPYLNRCIGLVEISEIVKKIGALYIAKGHVTSRAFVQPQNLSSGKLDILVVEGKLEKLKSATDTLTEKQLHLAFPVEEGKILNLRDLEQGLEQLNRLQQNHSELDLQPGTETGTSVAVIRNTARSALHYGASLNNTGSEATGKTIATVFASWDNPFNVNDNIYFSINNAINGEKFAESKSASVSYSVAAGYGLYSYSSNYFEYQQMVNGATKSFITSGNSFNQTLSSDYTVYRGQNNKLSLAANLTKKKNQNYLENVFLDTSSRILYVFNVGANYTNTLDKGMLRAGFNWYKSLDILDAKTEIVKAEKDYQFNKYTADISINKQFEVGDYGIAYLGSIHLFYSPKAIIASEALSLGGRYSVRGIEGDSLTGYQGGYIRNELSHATALFGSRFNYFIGMDLGITDTPEYTDLGNETLMGSVLGIRCAYSHVNIDITYAHALKAPSYLRGDKQGIYASLQINF